MLSSEEIYISQVRQEKFPLRAKGKVRAKAITNS